MQKFLTPLVLTSLLLGQACPTLYAQQPSQTAPAQNQPAELLLSEGTDVPLLFDEDISSKSSAEGDEVTFVLAEDIKVGDVVVVKAGAKAQGEVTNAKKAGMMGKAGELNVRLNYLKVGSAKIKIRGTKGKEGESGTTGAIVLTVLFGPIGLIKHGKDIDIKKGTALKAYVSDDIKLPAAI
ncbi:MAG: hypothetical protein ABR907_07305 [Terracidiphilus sp.]